MPVSKKEVSPCPIGSMLSVIDGRWKGTILWRLLGGPMRTSELSRSIPEMTERMLIRHLHEMVEDGILLRHDKERVPPHVCYSISPYGMTLAPVLQKMCDWGRKHQARLKRNTKDLGACPSKPQVRGFEWNRTGT
jgi:DNA-binding HxlR family transcriptional regulator